MKSFCADWEGFLTNGPDEILKAGPIGEEHALRILNDIRHVADVLSQVIEVSQSSRFNIGSTPLPSPLLPQNQSVPPISFTTARARRVREYLARRRQRDQYFPADLFADPAWDMLLDLYASHHERARISVSSLCIAAAVPATTALRWIKAMEDAGYFLRSHDEHDGRRVFIQLSEDARSRMDAYFDSFM